MLNFDEIAFVCKISKWFHENYPIRKEANLTYEVFYNMDDLCLKLRVKEQTDKILKKYVQNWENSYFVDNKNPRECMSSFGLFKHVDSGLNAIGIIDKKVLEIIDKQPIPELAYSLYLYMRLGQKYFNQFDDTIYISNNLLAISQRVIYYSLPSVDLHMYDICKRYALEKAYEDIINDKTYCVYRSKDPIKACTLIRMEE